MIDIRPTEFVPLAKFGRAWRFTDPKYNVLPPAALADLHPINQLRAAALFADLKGACESFHSESRDPDTQIDATCENDEAHARITEALRALPIAADERIVVSWDRNDAVETSWRTFFTYWDDFCYPSSDDVTIRPLDGAWRLCYHHWERFSFSPL